MKEIIRKIVVVILTYEARLVLKKYNPKILLVTGSVGKTSAKDAAYSALKNHAFVRKSEKSFNSDIGAPLAVLAVPNGWGNSIQWIRNIIDGALLLVVTKPYPQWLVIEVGADRPGDISRSLAWLKPDVVLGTRFPDLPVHVEFYKDPEKVSEEELTPFSWLPENGVAVVSADDVRSQNAPIQKGVRTITYGFAKDAQVRGLRFRNCSSQKQPSGISFEVQYGAEAEKVLLTGIVGQTHATAVLAGIASALAVGESLHDAVQGFKDHKTPPGRMRLITGKNNTTIIDDTYNSSPAAAEEALRTLRAVSGSRKIAVLADMFELGTFSTQEHARIGAYAATCVDLLVTVGVRSKGTAQAALEGGMNEHQVQVFETRDEASSFLKKNMQTGDVVLIKGSQGMRMEHMTKALMKNANDDQHLLPRQDPEWLGR